MDKHERLRQAVAALNHQLEPGKPAIGPEFNKLLDEFYAALEAVSEGSPQE